MADQQASPTPAGNEAPQAQALGQMMMGEISPFPTDDELPDYSDDIADTFGLGGKAGEQPKPSESGPAGGASPAAATPAAEGGQGQAQPATPATPAAQPSGQQGDPQALAQPTQAPATPAATPVPSQGQQAQQPPAVDPTVAALTAQVQALTAHIANLQANTGQQGVGQQTPQAGPGEQQQPPQRHPLQDYRLAIPNDVTSAIFNEDPNIAQQGMTHLINSALATVHDRVIRHVDEIVEQKLAGYSQQQQLNSQQEQMRSEYFKDYPQHNEPGIRLIVAQEAQTMWTQNPALNWDATARAALGQRVNSRLGVAPAQQLGQQSQQQQQPATPAPRPAAQLGASPRPATPDGADAGQFIHDVLTA